VKPNYKVKARMLKKSDKSVFQENISLSMSMAASEEGDLPCPEGA
jgi:hypothetical protein